MNRKLCALIMTVVVLYGAHRATATIDTTSSVTVSPLVGNLSIVCCTGGAEFNLPPYGTNLVASVGPDGILLIDAGFASTGPALFDTLQTRGRTKIIVNTHFHGDHTFGNRFFKDDAVIMAEGSVLSVMSGAYYALAGSPDPNQPQVGFADSLLVHFNNEDIHIVHAPQAHTGGDVYAYFPASKIIAAGDLFFADEYPYIDLPGGGTVEGYLGQIQRFIDDFPDDVIFVPAHGRTYTKDDLRTYYRMLTETTRLVHEAQAAGQTAEMMVSNNLLADWAEWTGQFPTTSAIFWIQTNCVDMANAKPSICEELTKTLVHDSAAAAIAEYRKLKATRSDMYDFGEGQLNMLGYQLLARNRLADALGIFELNVEVFPQSANVYDSYGEALLIRGDTAQSILYYEKSLQYGPNNTNAVEMLKRLRGE